MGLQRYLERNQQEKKGKKEAGKGEKKERRRRADQSKINQIKVEIKSGVHLCFRAGTKFYPLIIASLSKSTWKI